MIRIAITTGEPAGVGPDIVIAALLECAQRDAWPMAFDVLGDAALLDARAESLGLAPAWRALLETGAVRVRDIALAALCVPGQLDARNGRYVLALLDAAIDGCLRGDYAALVTAPLQKSAIVEAGIPGMSDFTGHTEYLAACTGAQQVVMMLAGPQQARDGSWLRVALATTHLPLAEVPGAITRERLADVLRIVDGDLRAHFGIAAPRILVTGLNPHAGENGHLGREEIDVIAPALAAAQAAGIDARGPYPADTLFQPRLLEQGDCVLAMYHDQGLAPLKYATFGHGINVTLGLPLIRTSVDHGTALGLAGSGRAEHTSLLQAIDAAAQMVEARAASLRKT